MIFTPSSFCKKGKVKDETSKKIREINGGQIKEQDVPLTFIDFTNFFRCLVFPFSYAPAALGFEDETSKEIREINGGQIKEEDVLLT